MLWAIFNYSNYVTILSLQFSSSFAMYLPASAKNGGVLTAISFTINSESLVLNGAAISHKYIHDCATEDHYAMYIHRGKFAYAVQLMCKLQIT